MRQKTVQWAVRLFGILLMGAVMAGCSWMNPGTPTVVVSAAASLNAPLTEIQALYEAQHGPDVIIRLNFASSVMLQRQIESRATVDVFIPAATTPMTALVEKGLVAPEAVRILARNKLVLVRPANEPPVVMAWEDLASDRVKRVALGNPDHVPAGQYGQAVLTALGIWPQVAASKLTFSEDVLQVVHSVENGMVAAGVVYATDAAASPKLAVVAEAPAGTHAPIEYPIAVLKAAEHPEAAQEFVNFVLSPAGLEVLRKYGFIVDN